MDRLLRDNDPSVMFPVVLSSFCVCSTRCGAAVARCLSFPLSNVLAFLGFQLPGAGLGLLPLVSAQ